jgi:hypothetical protein
LSSITVERLSIAIYGYPSTYVCGEYCEQKKITKWSIENNKKSFSDSYPYYRLIISIILLPILIPIELVNKSSLKLVILKSLPSSTVEMMSKNFEAKTKSAGLAGKHINFEESRNWFQFVCFYCFYNYENAAHRLYNYLTIYGFMRNMCLIFNLITWVLFLHSFSVCKDPHGYYTICVDNYFITLSFLALLLSATLFFAFMKFYRRYTEEAILAFATVDDNPKI